MAKNKYEQEIEEILSKYEEEKGHGREVNSTPNATRPTVPIKPSSAFRPNNPPNYPRKQYNSRPRYSMSDLKHLTSGQYMAAAFGVAILALAVKELSAAAASFLVIVSVVLFLVPILLNYGSGSSSSGSYPRDEKRWRGQVIDLNTRRPINEDPLESIKRLFRRR
ncbi:MAG: hypothetical protein M3014_03015 [Chloroflexota bacterium]|nr:hypothetical protein [Chloroflexota bacterium]